MTRQQPSGDTNMVLYAEDVERMNRLLDEFLRLSAARLAFLVDRTGRVITRRGQDLRLDVETLGALAAGTFAATREMARLAGEEQFSGMTHQGQRTHMHIARVEDRTLFAVLFDEKTTLGMVKLYAGEAARRLAAVFDEMRTRRTTPAEALEAGFGQSAKSALDQLLRD
ncbi:MAG TPA: roadblock/LC7 domain-containing protein [Planctomycetota bacterium]|jgi:predicted regulator of Ras-like GTPase activity (Roadblock/LC7/MglB family)|nr:roadblock/LC7 domain-containing protein [Planctomycetota bacterium]